MLCDRCRRPLAVPLIVPTGRQALCPNCISRHSPMPGWIWSTRVVQADASVLEKHGYLPRTPWPSSSSLSRKPIRDRDKPIVMEFTPDY